MLLQLNNISQQGLWIQQGALQSLVDIRLEIWNRNDGERRIVAAQGSMKVGDGYASDYLVVYPFANFSSQPFEMTLKLDSKVTSEIHIYHSSYLNNAQSWRRVPNVDIKNNIARFSRHEGGIYVARTQPATAAIVGIVIAVIAGVVVVLASVIYFKRRPEAWTNVSDRARNIHRSLQSKI